METLAIIPARYKSSRLPGKPLAKIGDKSMVMHVYDRVKSSGVVSKVVVATDHEDIANEVRMNGGNAIMTHSDHSTGTERCTEAFRKCESSAGIVINVQGDEPFVSFEALQTLVNAFKDPQIEIATLATPIDQNEELMSPDAIKVVIDNAYRALYFSRSPIPFMRDEDKNKWANKFPFLRHVGIYAFKNHTLEQIAALPNSGLEDAESLEQLRWMENGFPVHVLPGEISSFSVDTHKDLEKARKYYKDLFNQ